MANISGNVEDKLALLRRMYLDQMPAKVAEFTALDQPSDDASDEDFRTYFHAIEALAHKLAGSGATYGFPDISEAAKALELKCGGLGEGDLDDRGQAVSSVRTLESSLRDVIDGIIQDDNDAPEPSVETNMAPSAGTGRTVALVGDAEGELRRIGDELDGFDFTARYINIDDGLIDALIETKPVGIVFNLSDDSGTGLENMSKLHADDRCMCPLVVLSDRQDIDTRLKVARAHSEHFMMHPVMTADIVDILDQMVVSDGGGDFRILVVDDDLSTARYTQTVLQGAGMICEYITEPLTIMDVLDDFSPELILMDLYMPDCNGQELAAVIRQQESFSGIPIVFLSGEADVDKQLVAMRAGGDDFLTKPIKSNHLISSVSMRVLRFRMLRSQMVRDSMTGLLNHTTTHEFMDKEVARAHRAKTSLAVASLDIDHFKAVNDTHGHGVGDVVIKSLSRLMKQRLRSTDIIGRMGGEEFAAVLTETTAEQAASIFNQIRQDFADIVYKSDAGDFSVTLSCGIAEYPAQQSSAELLEASDSALYKAKHGGRNKVVLDDSVE
ncbi:MAG: diguanylate cyclase [Alphaproteobacteria bacterium]